MELTLTVFITFVCGAGLGWVIYNAIQSGIRKFAQSEAQELIQEAKDKVELQLLDEKERMLEIETELWGREEPHIQKVEERIVQLEEMVDENKQKHDNFYSVERQKALQLEKEVKAHEEQVAKLEEKLQSRRASMKSFVHSYRDRLAERLQVDKKTIEQQVAQRLIEEAQRRSADAAQKLEEDTKEHAEMKAKSIIDRALCRFQRPFSAERGIAPVYFETAEQRRVLCDAKGENIKTIQELTGCDVIVENDMEMIGVAGFDPVRRELTRRVLERCLKERKPIQVDFIKKTFENIKRELFSLIKRDGDSLAKELKLDGLHPEVRQMMGSLRYRYSFTQNQYFHCGEVGWLCGLLASELGGETTVAKARRSGMLHDLGKSMDHEIEGGHAVIGADFIEKRNEAADVIHAVRAHHYDVQPATDMAFLVIGADAISGARPGARRSTIESYNQKVTELETIALSFDGVTDCFILYGGRECRVLVDGRKIDDMRALKLSKEISTRIENECNYPGQIKVVVVRETVTVEATRTH